MAYCIDIYFTNDATQLFTSYYRNMDFHIEIRYYACLLSIIDLANIKGKHKMYIICAMIIIIISLSIYEFRY